MSSLRERQKKQRREQILVSADKLFSEFGFAKTTMDSIAEQACVGVATIYSYFENKEGVAAALCHKDSSLLIQESEEFLKERPHEPLFAIHTLMNIYCKAWNTVSYDIMSELLSRPKQSDSVRAASKAIRQKQSSQIKLILEEGKTNDKISASLDTDTAAVIIIDLIDRHMNRIASHLESDPSEDFLSKILNVLFATWHK